MVKKKKEEKKEETPSKTKKTINNNSNIEIEKYSLTELFEKRNIKALDAVGFLEHYGLSEYFKKEFRNEKDIMKFSDGEFDNMYERYMGRII